MGFIKTKVQRFDKTLTGVIVGIVLPILGFVLSFYIKTVSRPDIDFDQYINLALNATADQQDILIFCMMPNMFLFYLTNFRWSIYEFTKGIVAVTLLLGLALFFLTL